MFGIIRPCRHRLGGELREAWRAHLCGLCLALRDDHGQLARLATNYDGLIISVLAEAQAAPGQEPGRRLAGPCPLRGMRRAQVAVGDCARLAATVSLVLAAAKARDHAADGDGIAGRPGLRAAAGALARGWEERGARAGAGLGFDTALLTGAVARQEALEAAAGPGTPILAVTEPTEAATAAAFAHTAVLAGQPGNEAPLAEAGRLFGRIAHLLDAVEDQAADAASGAWNPVTVTGTPLAEVARLCADALTGIRLALADADLTDRRLVDALLDGELSRSVRRVLRDAGAPATATAGTGTGHQHEHAACGHPVAGHEHAGTAPGHAVARPLAAVARVAALAGLASAAGLCTGEFERAVPERGGRRRRGCGGCCCDDCCCECGCECCAEGCCESCGDCGDCCDCSC
ncbi:MAG TPA: DUF5685 family protein [Trebonia sp.]|jgi:hypothetical protein|nr:DUF5685 family protein [Trebonia sp.]